MLAAFEFGQTYSKGTTKQKWNLWKPSISGSKNTNFTELLQRYVETTGVWTFFIWLVKNWAANEIEISYYYYEKQLIKKNGKSKHILFQTMHGQYASAIVFHAAQVVSY